jgi:hypothetical protein
MVARREAERNEAATLGLQHTRTAPACLMFVSPRVGCVLGVRTEDCHWAAQLGRQLDRQNTDCRPHLIPSARNPGSEAASHAIIAAGHYWQRLFYVRTNSETIPSREAYRDLPRPSPDANVTDARQTTPAIISNCQVGWCSPSSAKLSGG